MLFGYFTQNFAKKKTRDWEKTNSFLEKYLQQSASITRRPVRLNCSINEIFVEQIKADKMI